MWYKAKIRFQQSDRQEQEVKTINENYLHKAISFADVEQQLFEILGERLSDFDITAIARVNLTQVYLHEVYDGESEDPDDWYRCKVKTTTESLSGKEKTTNETYLITANSVPQAHRRIEDILKQSLIPYEIVDVGVWDILGINDSSDDSFKVDIANRIANLDQQIIEPVQKVSDGQLGIFDDMNNEDKDDFLRAAGSQEQHPDVKKIARKLRKSLSKLDAEVSYRDSAGNWKPLN